MPVTFGTECPKCKRTMSAVYKDELCAHCMDKIINPPQKMDIYVNGTFRLHWEIPEEGYQVGDYFAFQHGPVRSNIYVFEVMEVDNDGRAKRTRLCRTKEEQRVYTHAEMVRPAEGSAVVDKSLEAPPFVENHEGWNPKWLPKFLR